MHGRPKRPEEHPYEDGPVGPTEKEDRHRYIERADQGLQLPRQFRIDALGSKERKPAGFGDQPPGPMANKTKRDGNTQGPVKLRLEGPRVARVGAEKPVKKKSFRRHETNT